MARPTVKLYATIGGARAGRLETRSVVSGLIDELAINRAST